LVGVVAKPTTMSIIIIGFTLEGSMTSANFYLVRMDGWQDGLLVVLDLIVGSVFIKTICVKKKMTN
jgi:hypothetical protein